VWRIAGGAPVELAGFFAYSPAFTGGVFVAAGNLDGDSRAEIVTGPGPGSGPHIRVWRVNNGQASELAGFFAYAPAFSGGVRVAVGDLDGDGIGEIVTGAGTGGAPHVQTFALVGGAVTRGLSFFAYDPGFTGGIFVAAPAP
jgi:serralysin